MSVAWLKNRFTDLKYTGWIIKNWNYLRKGKYPLHPFFFYWFLYPIPRLVFGREKAIDVSRKIIKCFMNGNLIIPLPIKSLEVCYIALRDSVDFDAFREICIEDHYNSSQIKKGMTVVDIGAHIGTFTLSVAKKAGKQGKVITIEPELNNFTQLTRNLEINKIKNVIPVNLALSDFNGKGDFFVSKGSGCHSLLPREGENIINKIQVKIKTLDTLLEESNITRIDLLKIDAEEAELKILKGAEKTLLKNPQMKIVIAAYHSPNEAQEVVEYLKKLNFKPKIILGNFTLVIVE
ncbi:FkbM family methyltransferase [Patescibacteria group bacterium]|nr:FkbM family methyltransferase [Patescibacteria group bacterium]MBU4022807.1 FkbM family methyltransferase [Patescibacteria group bacterium]